MKIFFYGLFMDVRLLRTKGIEPSETSVGFVDGFDLRIGERATLAHSPDGRAYGVMMTITPDEVAGLYAEDGVADYRPERVTVTRMDGTQTVATCYNLPGTDIGHANHDYAESLLDVAIELGFPGSYLSRIRQACK